MALCFLSQMHLLLVLLTCALPQWGGWVWTTTWKILVSWALQLDWAHFPAHGTGDALSGLRVSGRKCPNVLVWKREPVGEKGSHSENPWNINNSRLQFSWRLTGTAVNLDKSKEVFRRDKSWQPNLCCYLGSTSSHCETRFWSAFT